MNRLLFVTILFYIMNLPCLFANKPKERMVVNSDSLIAVTNSKAHRHYQSGQYEESIISLKEVLELRKKYTPDNHLNIARTFMNITSAAIFIWDFDNALEYSFLANDIIQKYDTINALYPRNLLNLSLIYQAIGDHEKAMQYFKTSNSINLANLNNPNYFIDKYLEATLFTNLNDIINARKSWHEALDRTNNPYSIYNNLALNYIETGELEEAARYYELIFDLPDLQVDEMYWVYQNYGIFLLDFKGERDSALYYYNLALENALHYESQNKGLLALIYQNFGELYLKEGDAHKALDYFQLALVTVSNEFNDTDIFTNPETDDVDDYNRLYKILKLKARALFEFYLQNNHLQFLESSFEVSNQCFKLIDKMRYRITSEGSQYSISENERDVYTNAITTAYHLYKLTNESGYLDQAFEINEKGKAFVLLSHLRKQKAIEFGKIPGNLLEKERELNRQLSFYSEQILAERQKRQQDENKIRTWEEMLLTFNIEYDKLLREFEKKYPEYYNLKYRSDYINPPEIKRKLQINEAVIEYALVDSLLYTFVITREFSRFYRHNVGNGLSQQCNEFYRLISKQNFSKDVHETYRAYSEMGYHLYSLLLEPFEDDIKDKNLIIVADGEISYLPFDALLTEPYDPDEFNYRTLPYLIHRHSVSFSYSSTMHFNHGISRKAAKRSVLAFAPTYSNLIMDISPAERMSNADLYNLIILPGIRDEVRKISKLVKTDVHMDYDAIESNFKRLAPDYEILHLAMHTILNDKNPLYSKMAFTQLADSIDDGFLYAYEVYNMQLKAKLAVLSSCSSGFGKLQEGEGMQSLARGFAYAGCPSILMTLWEVADQSTIKLMTEFYLHLSQGNSKVEALRQSKLSFIANADHLKSNPYFWSSFIILGDPSPVYRTGKLSGILWLIPVLFFSGFIVYRKRMKKMMLKRNFGWVYF